MINHGTTSGALICSGSIGNITTNFEALQNRFPKLYFSTGRPHPIGILVQRDPGSIGIFYGIRTPFWKLVSRIEEKFNIKSEV